MRATADALRRPVPPVLPKLTIGRVDDPVEREADEVANAIVGMAPSVPHRTTRGAQGVPAADGDREPCRSGCPTGPRTQPAGATPASSGSRIDADIETTIARRRNAGTELERTVRNFFEPRLDTDLSAVRVHAGAEPAGLATRLNARAFSIGRDIYFGAGEYQPGTTAGRHLLGHELTHVLQHGTAATAIRRQENDSDDSVEQLIAAHTGRTGLDAAGLGAALRPLALRSDAGIATAADTLAAVHTNAQDNVAYAVVDGLTDAQVGQLAGAPDGRALLLALRDAMTGGIETPWEKQQIARINDHVSSIAVGTPVAALPPILPARAVIVVGSPTDSTKYSYDKSPYNFSNAAVKHAAHLKDTGFTASRITILFFSDGFRRRGTENGRDVYAAARAALEGTGAAVIDVASAEEIVNYLNTGAIAPAQDATTRDAKISQFAYFGHGTSGGFLLNWGWGTGTDELTSGQITDIDKDAFSVIGQSYLFTCTIAEGDKSFMSIWATHLGQLAIGPRGTAAFNARYEAADLEKAINKGLPEWFLGMPYLNKVRIIDERP